LENTSVFDDLGNNRLTASEDVTIFLAMTLLVGYSMIVLYNALSYAPLCYQRSKRKQRELRRDAKKDGDSSVDIIVIFNWISCGCFYTAFCYVHSVTANPYKSTGYVSTGLMLAYCSLPFVLRKYLIFPKSQVMQAYCAAYDTLAYFSIRNHLFLIGVVFLGMYKSYWFTFALLDIMTMSKTLEKVILSISIPINQLMQTFALFLIVICCYTAIAYKLFGPTSFISVNFENGEEVEEPVCETLIDCFVFSIYVGMRSGDMGEVLNEVDTGDSAGFRTRIIYDLSFFLILGVLLFDMVTGIILDTFGALREEVAERDEKMNNETFVSGLTREK
jgi:hypothetical protein